MTSDTKKRGLGYQIIGYMIITAVVVCISYFIDFNLFQGALLLAMFVAGMCIARGLELAWVRN